MADDCWTYGRGFFTRLMKKGSLEWVLETVFVKG